MARKLTLKQAAFVQELLKDFNATQAAIRAGYSKASAGRQAVELLAIPHIAEAISAARAARAERVQIEADDLLRELALIVRSDVRDYQVANDGTLTLRDGAPDRAWRAVASVKHKIRTFTTESGTSETNREIEFRLWPKVDAIKVTREHMGLTNGAEKPLNPADVAASIVAGVAALRATT